MTTQGCLFQIVCPFLSFSISLCQIYFFTVLRKDHNKFWPQHYLPILVKQLCQKHNGWQVRVGQYCYSLVNLTSYLMLKQSVTL